MSHLLGRSAFAAVALALALSSCGSLIEHDGPIAVTVVDLMPAVGAGQAWRVTFDVENDSADDLAVRALDVEMRLNGADLGRGTTDAPFRLPPYGGARVEATLEGTWLGLARQMLNLAERRSLDWQVRGTVTTEGPQPRVFRFRNDGTLLDDGEDW